MQHLRLNLADTKLTSAIVAEEKLGYHIQLLAATGGVGNAVFAGVWNTATRQPPVRWGITADELTAFCTALRLGRNPGVDPPVEHTVIPSSLAVYGDPDDRRYAIVLVDNPAAVAWDAGGSNDTPQEYEYRQATQYDDSGKRPFLLSPTVDGNYASVFRNDVIGKWISRPYISAALISDEVERRRREGYYPLDIQVTGSGLFAICAAIFARSTTITPRRFHHGKPAGPIDPYDDAVYRVMQAYGARQAAMALVKGTKLVLARAYTFAEPGYPLVVPWSSFRFESCTKSITAIMIHQLLYEGLLGLTATLVDVLEILPPPGQTVADKRFATITVQHLLDHTSGLPTSVDDVAVVGAFLFARLPMTPAQMASWMATQKLSADPGSFKAWAYNTFGTRCSARSWRSCAGSPSTPPRCSRWWPARCTCSRRGRPGHPATASCRVKRSTRPARCR